MRASNLMITMLVLAVAVGASAQTLDRTTTRVAPVVTQAPDTKSATITRDSQGIWHIEGDSLYDTFEAMGYAVATDRLFQMELYRRQARGTLSELFGAEFLGSDFLSTDIFLRNLMYSEDELTELFEELSPDAQALIQGYVDGVNQRIAEIYTNFMLMPYEYWIGSFFSFFVEGLDMELHLVEHEQEHLLYRISGLLGREHDVPADIAVGGSHLFERRNAVRLGDDGGVTETAEIGQEEQGIGARAHGILG